MTAGFVVSCRLSFVIPQNKTATLKEKIKKKYDDMKRVLDEDLRITLSQLDLETEAMERTVEDSIEKCYRLTQEIDQQLAELSAQMEKDQRQGLEKVYFWSSSVDEYTI